MKPDNSKANAELHAHPGLYRARLSCKIGMDTLEGKTKPPHGVQPPDWAMYNLLHAVEEIAVAMMPAPAPRQPCQCNQQKGEK